MLVYGDQGTGKTSFFGGNKSAMIFAVEPGAQFQSAYWRPIFRWEADHTGNDRRLSFTMMVQAVVAAKNEGKLKEAGIKLIVIDTIDRLYDLACRHLCEQMGVQTIGDIGYGKGYQMALRMIQEQIQILSSVISVSFISHAVMATEELESTSGVKKEVEKRRPSVDQRVGKWIAGEQNLVGYAYKSLEGHFLIKFKSDHRLETKDRTGFFEAYGKPIVNSWDEVTKVYNEMAKTKGIEIRSRWA